MHIPPVLTTRRLSVQLSAGQQTLVFQNLSPYLQDNSLQASTGEVTWRLLIPAKGEVQKHLSYKVRHPKE